MSRRRVRHAAFAAAPLTAVLCAVLGPVPARAAPTVGPSGLAFYAPPAPLPAGPHGELISYRTTTVTPDLPPVQAWDVLYKSQDATGGADAVTGTLLVPSTPWTGSGPRPVVDFAFGTQGLSQSSAPSLQLSAGTEYEVGDLTPLLADGYAVVATDYAGYTTGAVPDYIAGRSEGHAVLDAATAADEIPGAGLSPAAPTAIWGYSQGGGAAAWSGQLQPGYDPAMHLVGVAAGGTPSDLDAVGANLNGSAFFAFLLYSEVGLNQAYPSAIQLSHYLNAAGETAVAEVKSDTLDEALAQFALQNIDAYTINGMTLQQLEAVPAVAKVVAEQTLGATPIDVPVFQYHGAADEVVPLAQDETLNDTYCHEGVTDDFEEFPGDHLATDAEAAPSVVAWIADRFAGDAPPSNCGTQALLGL